MITENAANYKDVIGGTDQLSSGVGADLPVFIVSLQRFPLVHQVADFPHERLMAADERLGALAFLVEAWGGHLGLDVPNRLLALGDSSFELCNPALTLLDLAALAAGLAVTSFLSA